ncbi:flagellin [Halodesulfovibrio spirochaetisodalis]|uniref:flagellin n=1 Tax=Halodesulfovibrio spirochaetisodalis TaxID=1560234 RepID=UPI0009EE528E
MDVVVERSSAQDDPARSEEAVKVETVGYEETWRNQDLKNENLVLTAPARRDGTVTALGRQKITTTAGGTGTITFTSRSGLAEVETSLANANANGEICTMGGRLFGLALGAAGSTLNASTYSGAKVTIERSPLGFDNWTDITDTIAAGGTTVTGEVRITLVANDGSVIRDSLYNNTDEYRITKVTDTNFTIQSVAASTEAIQVQSEVAASKTFEHRSTSGITVTNDATTFFEVNSNTLKGATAEFRHNGRTGALTGNIASVESSVKSSYGTEKKPVTDIEVEIFNTQSNTWEKLALGSTDGNSVDILDTTEKFRITTTYGEDKKIRDTISNNTGGRFTVTKTQFGASLDMKTGTDAQKSSTQLHVESEDLIAVNIHFGTSSQKEDHYDTEITMATAKSLGVGQEAGDNILTQQNAKKALENIMLAINKKDKIRAEIGSTQNRLAATVEVGSIQKENLQASESRISDVNVATEMTTFNKQQILANAAVSMLAQANNLPKLAQKLLG